MDFLICLLITLLPLATLWLIPKKFMTFLIVKCCFNDLCKRTRSCRIEKLLSIMDEIKKDANTYYYKDLRSFSLTYLKIILVANIISNLIFRGVTCN